MPTLRAIFYDSQTDPMRALCSLLETADKSLSTVTAPESTLVSYTNVFMWPQR